MRDYPEKCVYVFVSWSRALLVNMFSPNNMAPGTGDNSLAYSRSFHKRPTSLQLASTIRCDQHPEPPFDTQVLKPLSHLLYGDMLLAMHHLLYNTPRAARLLIGPLRPQTKPDLRPNLDAFTLWTCAVWGYAVGNASRAVLMCVLIGSL